MNDMTETENTKAAAIDPRVQFTCGSRCCAVFKGEAKDIPFLRFMVPLAEGPWISLAKIRRLLGLHTTRSSRQSRWSSSSGEFCLAGNIDMIYGRCGLDQLQQFAMQHDAKNKPHAWFTDADGRLLLQVDGECFGLAHRADDDALDLGRWLQQATSDTCPCCGGCGMVWLDWDPTREKQDAKSR